MGDVHIIGAGIHPFGRHDGRTGLDQGLFAVQEALADAGVAWSDIQFAFGGSSASGNADALLPRLGLTGVQFINVANGCATGGSALLSGYWAIKSGEFDLGVVVGFDKHPRGAFNADPEASGLPRWYGEAGMMLTTQFFAMKIQRYMSLYGVTAETLGMVAEKAFENGAKAPHAWRREPVGLNHILSSEMVSDPLTKFMFCSPAEGGTAMVLASERKMRELGLKGPKMRSAAVRTRVAGSFEVFSPSLEIERGPSPTEIASKAAFEMAGLGPGDVDVAQIQDTESGAEVMHMAENGFCAHGEQEKLIHQGATRIGGRLPVNTDGGCLACGEPIGASGLRQVYENVQQLRGRAEGRQVEGARIGYSQVYGAPGISAVAILEA
ncbi:thiolase family protein [Phenylobacterium montanum]|uniref:Thiolase family protein n=1 Tax=Phenylobacterium montanum TaxID=2823693 RepID=A0A975G4F2_9CAUL|nr:thiolase family protein [Caulobacter sp. S6]QUD90383.1 thiolase family protein [Caulobacter sp. S6]